MFFGSLIFAENVSSTLILNSFFPLYLALAGACKYSIKRETGKGKVVQKGL
jgi:hypothetical protein